MQQKVIALPFSIFITFHFFLSVFPSMLCFLHARWVTHTDEVESCVLYTEADSDEVRARVSYQWWLDLGVGLLASENYISKCSCLKHILRVCSCLHLTLVSLEKQSVSTSTQDGAVSHGLKDKISLETSQRGRKNASHADSFNKTGLNYPEQKNTGLDALEEITLATWRSQDNFGINTYY